MLLHNKNKILIKHKTKDIEYSITWKYDNKLSNYHITIEKYINGYLSPGYTRQFYLNNLDMLEVKLGLFVDCNNCTVEAY